MYANYSFGLVFKNHFIEYNKLDLNLESIQHLLLLPRLVTFKGRHSPLLVLHGLVGGQIRFVLNFLLSPVKMFLKN